MITNCKVTIYTKGADDKYTHTVASAFWRDSKTVRADKLVVSIVDAATVMIPFVGNPPLHIAPKDYIVRGECAVEAPTDATLGRFIKESGARPISDAHCLDYGSLDMQHWELGVDT